MTQSFDEWSKNQIIMIKSEAKASFEAGAASRQAEIDELQKRIDGALKVLNDASPTMLDKKAIRILKGEK